MRLALISAAGALVVFQVADVVTTHRLLATGYHELNPLAGLLITAGWLLVAKLALSTGLLVRFTQVRPSVPMVCATWMVVGAYFAIALGNALALSRGA